MLSSSVLCKRSKSHEVHCQHKMNSQHKSLGMKNPLFFLNRKQNNPFLSKSTNKLAPQQQIYPPVASRILCKRRWSPFEVLGAGLVFSWWSHISAELRKKPRTAPAEIRQNFQKGRPRVSQSTAVMWLPLVCDLDSTGRKKSSFSWDIVHISQYSYVPVNQFNHRIAILSMHYIVLYCYHGHCWAF